jgi:hypothetical protein
VISSLSPPPPRNSARRRLVKPVSRLRVVVSPLPSTVTHLLMWIPFVINNGLWPSVLVSIGDATLVVSEHVYV